jgi:hypothetical protein
MIRGPLLEASAGQAPGTAPVSDGKPRLAAYPATWVTTKGGNDTYWRAEAPAAAVGGRVSYVLEKHAERAFQHPNRDTGLPWQAEFHTPDGIKVARTKKEWQTLARGRLVYDRCDVVFPDHEGAAVFTRPMLSQATLARYMRDQGVRTIAETDDNYFSPIRWNLFLRRQGNQGILRQAHAHAFASMDACVFSTDWLRDRYWREFRKRFGDRGRKLEGMPEMFVCRNNIPVADWPERDPGDGRVRVGFMGSTSHLWDVHIAYAAFHAAKQMAGTETIMVGYNPADPNPDTPEFFTDADTGEDVYWETDKAKGVREKWAAVVDRHIRWVDPGKYRRAPLPFDIGVAPLHDNEFNRGRSDSKLLEFTISGAAIVAQRLPVFTSAGWRDGENCLLASSPREMAEQVVRLVRDPGLRYGLVSAAQEMVATERNEDTLKREWGYAIGR